VYTRERERESERGMCPYTKERDTHERDRHTRVCLSSKKARERVCVRVRESARACKEREKESERVCVLVSE